MAISRKYRDFSRLGVLPEGVIDLTPEVRPAQGKMLGTRKLVRAGQAASALLLAMALWGCSSVADNVPTGLGGLPEGVPPRAAGPTVYPAVHDMPPPREDAALSEAESKRLRDELKNTRNRLLGPDATGTAGRTTGAVRNP